jgi:uncharacterized membrane-anchored protein YitT (DUF2179 family)
MDNLLLSLMVILVISYTVNKVILWGDKKVQILIISPQAQQIRQTILDTLDCGVTMLNVESGYEGAPQQAILSVVYSRKYLQIRNAALQLDPHAFIVVSDVTNVSGRGYTLSRLPKE